MRAANASPSPGSSVRATGIGSQVTDVDFPSTGARRQAMGASFRAAGCPCRAAGVRVQATGVRFRAAGSLSRWHGLSRYAGGGPSTAIREPTSGASTRSVGRPAPRARAGEPRRSTPSRPPCCHSRTSAQAEAVEFVAKIHELGIHFLREAREVRPVAPNGQELAAGREVIATQNGEVVVAL
jgi:hypothetical protein